MKKHLRRVALLTASALAVAGCGGDASPTTATTASTATTSVTFTTSTTLGATTSTTPPTSTIATTSTAATTTTGPDTLVCRDGDCPTAAFDYLIVTRPMFEDALLPFAEWKTAAGHRAGLVTVDWLAATYPGDHLAEQMKTGMHDLRIRSGVRWVLLVGDTEMTAWDSSVGNVLASYDLTEPWNVPTGFYRRVETDPADEVLPSDAYFVEDRDWDPESTGLNPRPDDPATGEGTISADLYLGRWPVRDPAQVAALTAKSMAVTPTAKVLFTADTTLSDGVATWCSGWPPAPSEGFYCYLDTMVTGRTTFFEATAPGIATESRFVDLTDAAGSAAFFEAFRTFDGAIVAQYHGNSECWWLQADCLDPDEIVFEHIVPLVEGEACVIDAFYFDGGESVAESMVLAPTGPAVFTHAPNPVLFLRDLRAGIAVGEAFWDTASQYLYWPNPITLLGDPSLPVFVP